ncbi:hypothetical protein CROQUDRAFT_274633 [Cronartium quercuum f. sp. fusiforme G11]|uniref:Uncharacterized protein n=1 Tax=Cronartium quercuum f. sp. fusiforme G11 TaxID=708437 RepID=A0A9P6NT01_9BASI|nr:hypothetical protein CROQUDRAFT_274633 [Cronartium quercuum f. sp. fusiforme G11]
MNLFVTVNNLSKHDWYDLIDFKFKIRFNTYTNKEKAVIKRLKMMMVIYCLFYIFFIYFKLVTYVNYITERMNNVQSHLIYTNRFNRTEQTRWIYRLNSRWSS